MEQITRKNYHTDTSHISKSGLDLIAQSPAHYLHRYKAEGQRKRKKHFDIGTAAHTFILEPHLIDTDLAVVPDYAPNRPTKTQLNADVPSQAARKSIAFWDHFDTEHAEKAHITAADLQDIKGMRDAVHTHPACVQLLHEGQAEYIHTWIDPKTGVPMKMRADWLSSKNIIVDVKTTDDASANAFARSCRKWRYDVQAAVYLDGLGAANFVFIAVEKKPPYAVAVYYATNEMVNDGRTKRDADLDVYADCLATGHFPAYSDNIEPISW